MILVFNCRKITYEKDISFNQIEIKFDKLFCNGNKALQTFGQKTIRNEIEIFGKISKKKKTGFKKDTKRDFRNFFKKIISNKSRKTFGNRF